MGIDGSDDDGPSSDRLRSANATLQRVSKQRAADTFAGKSNIDGKLTEEDAWNRIGRPAGTHFAG